MADPAYEFLVRFRGVRGSYPSPGPQTSRIGGNTPCIEVRAGGHVIALDAGTGIIGLGADLVREYWARPAESRGRLHCTVVLTHMHHDHIQGYPFFSPLYMPQTKVHVYGPRMLREDLAAVLSGAMVAPYFPVDAESLACERTIRNITELDAIVFRPSSDSPEPEVMPANHVLHAPDLIVIRAYHSLNHPRGGCFLYRIDYAGRRLVYATDTEGYVGGDTRLIRFAEGADVLIHDAQYRHHEYVEGLKQGWGHSTVEMAIDVAQQAKAKQLVLFHHAPTNDDDTILAIESEAQALFPASLVAYEGLTIEL